MTYARERSGFTIIEIVVSIAIIGIIAAISTVGLRNWQESAARKVAAQDVYQKLRTAREKTLGSDGDTVYGVRIESTSVTLFSGYAYMAGAPGNIVYDFESGVTATSSLRGRNIVFERLTGRPSATGTVYVRSRDGNATNTVILYGSGLVDY